MFFLLFRDMDSIYRFFDLCVGILYETHGGWQIPARYFLFNIFNNTYRYATHGGWQITIIFAILGCVLIYEVGRWKIIHYEWI